MEFKAGDILFTRGAAWYSKLIRWGTRNTGEAPSRTNHTGVGLNEACFIQALNKVVITEWSNFSQNNAPETFEVWRNESLTETERTAVADKALGYVGRNYGYFKILLQGFDCLLGKVFCTDVMLFRRLAFMDRYPICSWVVAFAYDHGIRYRFGVPPNVADPDEIHDWVASHGEWRRII